MISVSIGILADANSRIDRYDHSFEIEYRAGGFPRHLDHVAVPQGALDIIENFGVEFLPPEPRPFVHFDDLREKRGREGSRGCRTSSRAVMTTSCPYRATSSRRSLIASASS